MSESPKVKVQFLMGEQELLPKVTDDQNPIKEGAFYFTDKGNIYIGKKEYITVEDENDGESSKKEQIYLHQFNLAKNINYEEETGETLYDKISDIKKQLDEGVGAKIEAKTHKEWNGIEEIIPNKQAIIYLPDSSNEYSGGIKIGDGNNIPNNLPFLNTLLILNPHNESNPQKLSNIIEITQEEYDELLASNGINDDWLYITTEDTNDTGGKMNQEDPVGSGTMRFKGDAWFRDGIVIGGTEKNDAKPVATEIPVVRDDESTTVNIATNDNNKFEDKIYYFENPCSEFKPTIKDTNNENANFFSIIDIYFTSATSCSTENIDTGNFTSYWAGADCENNTFTPKGSTRYNVMGQLRPDGIYWVVTKWGGNS